MKDIKDLNNYEAFGKGFETGVMEEKRRILKELDLIPFAKETNDYPRISVLKIINKK